MRLQPLVKVIEQVDTSHVLTHSVRPRLQKWSWRLMMRPWMKQVRQLPGRMSPCLLTTLKGPFQKKTFQVPKNQVFLPAVMSDCGGLTLAWTGQGKCQALVHPLPANQPNLSNAEDRALRLLQTCKSLEFAQVVHATHWCHGWESQLVSMLHWSSFLWIHVWMRPMYTKGVSSQYLHSELSVQLINCRRWASKGVPVPNTYVLVANVSWPPPVVSKRWLQPLLFCPISFQNSALRHLAAVARVAGAPAVPWQITTRKLTLEESSPCLRLCLLRLPHSLPSSSTSTGSLKTCQVVHFFESCYKFETYLTFYWLVISPPCSLWNR